MSYARLRLINQPPVHTIHQRCALLRTSPCCCCCQVSNVSRAPAAYTSNNRVLPRKNLLLLHGTAQTFVDRSLSCCCPSATLCCTTHAGGLHLRQPCPIHCRVPACQVTQVSLSVAATQSCDELLPLKSPGCPGCTLKFLSLCVAPPDVAAAFFLNKFCAATPGAAAAFSLRYPVSLEQPQTNLCNCMFPVNSLCCCRRLTRPHVAAACGLAFLPITAHRCTSPTAASAAALASCNPPSLGAT